MLPSDLVIKKLVKRVREAMYQREEIASGYRYRLDSGAVSLTETAEWMNMERLLGTIRF